MCWYEGIVEVISIECSAMLCELGGKRPQMPA